MKKRRAKTLIGFPCLRRTFSSNVEADTKYVASKSSKLPNMKNSLIEKIFATIILQHVGLDVVLYLLSMSSDEGCRIRKL